MPPRKAPAVAPTAPEANEPPEDRPNPGRVPSLGSPAIEAEPDSIDPAPNHDQEQYSLPADIPLGEDDTPGPSSTYIPRQPSPPLPNLHTPSFPPGDEDEEDEDEEDEVVSSMPIYISPALFPSLHIFQYPLHHRSLTAPVWAKDRGKRITTRVKENVGRVEVEIPVDGDSVVWREDRARDLGFVTDVNAMNGHGEDVVGGYGFGGREKEKEKDKKGKKKKEEKWGDKARLRSELVPNATGYYSGIVRDGALHLHPVSKVMQFRTSLAYIDEIDVKNRERAGRKRGGDDDDEEESKPRAAAPAVPIRPGARKVIEDEENDGSGSIKDFRNKMWSTAANEDADAWVPYSWKERDDELVDRSFQSLTVSEDKRVRLHCRTRGLDYLNRS